MPPDPTGLPAALTTAQAAELLNMSPSALERAARRGDAPIPFFRWGRALRWPRQPLLELLGLANGNGAPTEAPPAQPDINALTRSGAQYVTQNANHPRA